MASHARYPAAAGDSQIHEREHYVRAKILMASPTGTSRHLLDTAAPRPILMSRVCNPLATSALAGKSGRKRRAQAIAHDFEPTNQKIERGNNMANPRQDDRSTTPRVEDTVQQMGDRTAEQANRASQAAGKMAQAGADAGGKIAEAGASLLHQNAETIQNALRASVDLATSLMGRSTNQLLDRTLGSPGKEAEQITERTTRNAEAILYSTSEASKAMSEISREYFEFTKQQVEKSIERLNQLQTCRNPQEFAAAHSDFVREMMAGFFESSRRMAEMSLKLADNAGKRVTQVDRHAA